MKRWLPFWLACSLAACDGAGAISVENSGTAFPFFTEEGGRVRDQAGVLSDETERQLAASLELAETSYGQQMGIATVPSLQGMTIEDFSLEYARAWQLGDAQRNDGILLLVAPNERKVRIEIGIGIEESFTDEYCQQVLDKLALPNFRAENFEAGIEAATEALISRMRSHPSLPANDNTRAATLEEAA